MKKPAFFGIVISVAVILMLIAAVLQRAKMKKQITDSISPALISQNKKQADSCIALLQAGDLLLRTGNDEISDMFRRLNAFDRTYSHSGIVVMEHGYPFVYHSIGGADNPNERLRRDSASVFIAAAHNLGFGIVRYDFTPAQRNAFCSIADSYYRAKPLFDMDFDLETDDKLYCSEFVYKAVLRAAGDSLYLPVTTKQDRSFVGVDNLYKNKHAQTICELRYK